MPFEKGHTKSARPRLFEGALKRAIAQDDGKRLRAAAESLLTQAADGEQWAIQYLADRLDGKAAQAVEMTVNKPVEELTLAELTAQLAAATGRGVEASTGADQPSELH